LSKADGEYRILIEAGRREEIRAVLKDGFSTFKAAGFLEKEERAEKELKAAGVLYVRRHDGIYSLVDEPGGELITAPHVFEWIAKTHKGSHIDHMGVHHAIAKLAKRGLLVKQEGGSGASVYELSYDAGKQGKSIDPVELLVLQTICRKSGAHIRGVFDGDVRMEVVKKKAA
jgi:Fe2+ or Zn2+ uptake regulation protein